MHVLVTGGAGFIGSHLVEALLARGDEVTVLDDFSSGAKSNLPASDRLQLIDARLGPEGLADLTGARFDAVVHLAGLPSVAASWQKETEAHDRNLTTTVALIADCAQRKIPRMIFASSAAVYGMPSALPIPESAICQPLSPYGLQKLTSERYLELFARQHGLRAVALRLFNVYGPRQRPDSAYSGAISIFADAIRKRQTLTVFGDGSQTRDFVFVTDVVSAFRAALDVPMEAGDYLPLNVGTGRRSSLLDVIEALHAAVGGEAPRIHHEENRSGDIVHSQPDISAATRILGFAPRFSLKEGLRSLVETL